MEGAYWDIQQGWRWVSTTKDSVETMAMKLFPISWLRAQAYKIVNPQVLICWRVFVACVPWRLCQLSLLE